MYHFITSLHLFCAFCEERRDAKMNLTEILEHHDALLDLGREHLEKLSASFRDAFDKSAFEKAKQNWIGFYRAINWKEDRWISIVLLFHLATLLFVVKKRHREQFQVQMFVVLGAFSFLAERMNGFLAKRWSLFSTQNYFDARGAFVSVIWNAPLMVNLVIILVNFLRLTVKEMVKMKKAQMKSRYRESKKEGRGDAMPKTKRETKKKK